MRGFDFLESFFALQQIGTTVPEGVPERPVGEATTTSKVRGTAKQDPRHPRFLCDNDALRVSCDAFDIIICTGVIHRFDCGSPLAIMIL